MKKIYNLDKLKNISVSLKKKSKKIVLCHKLCGTFDDPKIHACSGTLDSPFKNCRILSFHEIHPGIFFLENIWSPFSIVIKFTMNCRPKHKKNET